MTTLSLFTFRGEVGGRFKRKGTYVHLWQIYVDVWQLLLLLSRFNRVRLCAAP